MKGLRKHFRLIAMAFGILVLLQSCVAYKKGNYTLEQAVAEQNRVKVRTAEGKTIKYEKVEFLDGTYYGRKMIKGKSSLVALDEEDISDVMLQNKKMSTQLSIIAPFVVIGVVLGIRESVRNSISVGW
ncbi:hypothetical protein WJN01_14885 [Flavobacteriaceae bacterium SZ-1-7]|uniref:hypothetical protein n=1 Tax=Tamlana sedimenti TaxID=3134126 RepID=UPI0031210046